MVVPLELERGPVGDPIAAVGVHISGLSAETDDA
jgi:hypothetical protein